MSEGLYEEPNVATCYMTVVFSFVSDEDNEPLMRRDIESHVHNLAIDLGCDYEIHGENMLSDQLDDR